MAPGMPFTPLLLLIQLFLGGLGVAGVLAGENIGYAPIALAVLFTFYLTGVYNESSTNPEHDEIINTLAGMDIRLQDAGMKNHMSRGGNWDEVRALEQQQQAYNNQVELDSNGLYRFKR